MMKNKQIVTTLCMVMKGKDILLGMKKRGFGRGKWNGFGGKVEIDETIIQSVQRETFEECGIVLKEIKKVGILEFEFVASGEYVIVNVFRSNCFEGEPYETEEMKPMWFSLDEIPFKNMWPDDFYWIPLMLAGKNFKGKFVFDKNGAISNFSLKEVAELHQNII